MTGLNSVVMGAPAFSQLINEKDIMIWTLKVFFSGDKPILAF